MPEQLHYMQLITNKANAADLSNSVSAILISDTRKKYTAVIAVSQI